MLGTNSISAILMFSSVIKFLVVVNYLSVPVNGECGYSNCPLTKPGYINVHLVAHSHDDVGWLKTVDQYYYGSNNSIQRAAVQYTLDSVVTELQKNPDRRFIYVESAFFWRWWTNQDEDTKQAVRKLVSNGQLEFILGGWSMNDEGSTHYNALIDQMSLGLRYLNDTFGECARPKAAWQIDSFGHSREQASLFAQMGFDGLFIGRLDYQDKGNRKFKHEMEMIWNASPRNLGKSAWLFTGVLFNYYMQPDGFCFDILCDDDPINDDPKLAGYNVEEKVKEFISISKYWAQPYDTNHVLMTMGSDFHYMAAHTWFKNLDKLIKYVNRKQITDSSRVNLIYSTPSCYLEQVHKSKKPLTMKTDDFFPYSNDPYGFWSGYFTSRPTFKYYCHKANNILQVCKQLAVGGFQGKPSQRIVDKVWELSEPVAIVQHHDAITGTAKQHVTDDYSLRLAIGIKNCEEVIDEAFGNLFQFSNLNLKNPPSRLSASKQDKVLESSFKFCQLLNISACGPSEEMKEFLVSVYNPLARSLYNEYVRIPVVGTFWKVESENEILPVQLIKIPKAVLEIPGRKSIATHELVFSIDELEGLQLTNFRVNQDITARDTHASMPSSPIAEEQDNEFINNPSSSLNETEKAGEDIVIKNSNGVGIILDKMTGLLKSVIQGSMAMPLEQNFYYYLGMAGNNSRFPWRASGAYIFRPNTSSSNNHQPKRLTNNAVKYEILKGKHVTEVHQTFADWVSQIIRLYDNSDVVEFEWLVGPIPIKDGYGKEIITRYTTNIPTNGTFFTDSNGRELMKRKRDHRETFPFRKFEPVAGNYYPVPSRMLISENEDLSLNGQTVVVLNDRSQAGTSMNDGEIELLVHRRLLYDDAFGVEEPLNETAYGKGLVARGKHWLLLAGNGTGVPISKHREIGQKIFMEKVLGFADVSLLQSSERQLMRLDSNLNINLATRKTIFSDLASLLPSNIHLLTFEPVSPNKFLFRLEHFYETDDGFPNSRYVRISLKVLKQALPFVKSIKETSLGGNQWIEDVKRFEWPLKSKESKNEGTIDAQQSPVKNEDARNGTITNEEILFRPMEIKTFILYTFYNP